MKNYCRFAGKFGIKYLISKSKNKIKKNASLEENKSNFKLAFAIKTTGGSGQNTRDLEIF